MLASASDAIIIGFNVRPAGNARQLADKEKLISVTILLSMQLSMT
jgi:translation initiation factor IF-2